MRRNYIVTYDICDPKRLRQVHKTCKGYGQHLQYSVFECDLTAAEKATMESRLTALIHHHEDQVLFIDLGPAASRGDRSITAIGQTYEKVDLPCFVV